MQVELRMATPNDVEKLMRVHHSAIRADAVKVYPQQVIDDWAGPITSDKVEAYRQRIASGEEITVVAKQAGEIVGFGAIVEQNSELRAVYVSPSAGRSGIGGIILLRLEQIAKQREMKELNLSSSLNAEAFYKAKGYSSLGRDEHTLRSGLKMACVKMRKTL